MEYRNGIYFIIILTISLTFPFSALAQETVAYWDFNDQFHKKSGGINEFYTFIHSNTITNPDRFTGNKNTIIKFL